MSDLWRSIARGVEDTGFGSTPVERHIASRVLVWPSLESSSENAMGDHLRRVAQVKEVIARGAAKMAYSTRFETDYGLRWDHDREVWTDSGGSVFDGRGVGDTA